MVMWRCSSRISSLPGVGRSARHKAIALGRVARSPGGRENFGGSRCVAVQRCVAFRGPGRYGSKVKDCLELAIWDRIEFLPVALLSILFKGCLGWLHI